MVSLGRTHRPLIDWGSGLAQIAAYGDEPEGLVTPTSTLATRLERPYSATCQETVCRAGADLQGRP